MGVWGYRVFAASLALRTASIDFDRQLTRGFFTTCSDHRRTKRVSRRFSTGVVESRLRLYTEHLYRMHLLVPSMTDQGTIVRFLDYAERGIGRYIRAKQKLIKLLE